MPGISALRPGAECRVELKYEVPATVVGRATRGVGGIGLASDSTTRLTPQAIDEKRPRRPESWPLRAMRSAPSVRPRHVLAFVCDRDRPGGLRRLQTPLRCDAAPNFVGPATVVPVEPRPAPVAAPAFEDEAVTPRSCRRRPTPPRGPCPARRPAWSRTRPTPPRGPGPRGRAWSRRRPTPPRGRGPRGASPGADPGRPRRAARAPRGAAPMRRPGRPRRQAGRE